MNRWIERAAYKEMVDDIFGEFEKLSSSQACNCQPTEVWKKEDKSSWDVLHSHRYAHYTHAYERIYIPFLGWTDSSHLAIGIVMEQSSSFFTGHTHASMTLLRSIPQLYFFILSFQQEKKKKNNSKGRTDRQTCRQWDVNFLNCVSASSIFPELGVRRQLDRQLQLRQMRGTLIELRQQQQHEKEDRARWRTENCLISLDFVLLLARRDDCSPTEPRMFRPSFHHDYVVHTYVHTCMPTTLWLFCEEWKWSCGGEEIWWNP